MGAINYGWRCARWRWCGGMKLMRWLVAWTLVGALALEEVREPEVLMDPHELFSGSVEVVTEGAEDVAFTWTEGPVWARDGLYFSDTIADVIARYEPASGTTRIVARESGGGRSFSDQLEPGSNGLAVDGDDLVVCQHGQRRVVRAGLDTLDGGRFRASSVVAESAPDGRRLNSPNDVVLVDGDVYFTDPIYGFLRRDPEEPGAALGTRRGLPSDQPYLDAASEALGAGVKGVYRTRRDGTIETVLAALDRPNGLAFSPNGTLWVANSALGNFSVYGSEGTRLDMVDAFGPGLLDGIKVDEDGRLWATVPGGLVVVDLETRHVLAKVAMGVNTANIAFGEDGFVYITGKGAVWRIRRRRRGECPAILAESDGGEDRRRHPPRVDG